MTDQITKITATRGLDIRCKMALARVLHSIDPECPYKADFYGVYAEAIWMGRLDYQAGRFDVPCLFADDPALSAWWRYGQDFASDLEEMASCPGCNDGTGNPCITHG